MENTEVTKNTEVRDNVEEMTTNPGDVIAESKLLQIMAAAGADAEIPLSVHELRVALKLFKEAVLQQLRAGCKVQLTGFLSFVPVYRPSRKINNIATHSLMEVPESVQVVVKAGSLMRKAIQAMSPERVQKLKARTK